MTEEKKLTPAEAAAMHERKEWQRRLRAAAQAMYLTMQKDESEGASELEDLKKRAEAGEAEAESELGWRMIRGLTDGNIDLEGWTYLKKAAEAGSVKAKARIGMAFREGYGIPRDEAKAVNFTREAAEAGDSDAMVTLAAFHREGYGVEKSLVQCAALLQKASDAGNAVASRELASMLSRGEGLDQDWEKAFALNEKAARAGDLDARIAFAKAKLYGTGTVQDKTEAGAWILLSAVDGAAEASRLMTELKKTLTEDSGVRVNKRFEALLKECGHALTWSDKALTRLSNEIPEKVREQLLPIFTSAENGVPACEIVAGRACETGWHVSADALQAFRWYWRAAQARYAEGAYLLSFCYLNGIGVPPDAETGIGWLSEAAKGGFPEAMGFFGSLLLNGNLGEDAVKFAVPYLERAAEAGDAYGTLNLGIAKLSGRGTPRDREAGKELVKKAAELGSADAQGLLPTL